MKAGDAIIMTGSGLSTYSQQKMLFAIRPYQTCQRLTFAGATAASSLDYFQSVDCLHHGRERPPWRELGRQQPRGDHGREQPPGRELGRRQPWGDLLKDF